jgi:hypothetical protein
MPRRGPRRITLISVGTPPPLTPRTPRPLAMEILHRLEAKQAAERQDGLERQEGRSSKETPGPNEP